MTQHRIPSKARAGIGFAGVELAEATPLLVSLFAGLGAGSIWGWPGYVGVPLVGYMVNKAYLEWKKGRLPGHLAVLLYKYGITGFSPAFNKQEKLFIGNSATVNPHSTELIDAHHQKLFASVDTSWK